MKLLNRLNRRVALLLGLALCTSQWAWADEIRVITSGAFSVAYKQLVPLYEQASGHTVISSFGASVGNAPDSIPSRLARGEKFDILILSGDGLEALVKQGHVQPGSRVDLVRSIIGVSVRKGTPKPDISTVAALKQTLLNAKSIAYSASASGTYLSNELFPRLGVAEQIKDKAKKIYSERVGAVVARGDAEIGFQQVSELLPFKELDFVGPLPEEVQQTIFFSAGLGSEVRAPEAARHLVRYLASPAAAPIVRATGLDPVAKETK